MNIGVITERKNPPDRRVVLSPQKIKEVLDLYRDVDVIVEKSDVRIFSDQEYIEKGITVSEDLSSCDLLLGVKEVPISELISDKTYLFFSHTMKMQPHNRKLLQACLEKNITLIDFEALVDANNKRIIGFGRYAGIIGVYNSFRAFGIKYDLFNLVPAITLGGKDDLLQRLKRPYLPPIKIVLSGFGRVGHGAKEILDEMKIKQVSIDDFLTKSYDVPVYTHIGVTDYYKRIDGAPASKQDFYAHPEKYTSDFQKFSNVADIFIAGHLYKPGSPKILTKEMLNAAKNQIKVIGDITCDIGGSIESTIRASTIADPLYGYYPRENKEVYVDHPAAIVVMAVDNLPCELPKEASENFGADFIERILPSFFNDDKDGILSNATITKDGKLTERFSYLQEFVDNK